jgi:hypothetical protein
VRAIAPCATAGVGFIRSGIADQLEAEPVLWAIVVVLLILWLLGLLASVTLGGLIHVLLVIAVIVVVMQLLSGRRSV